MVFEMKLNQAPYNKIVAGDKTIELRLYDEKRRALKIGDYIIFSDANDSKRRLLVIVRGLYHSENFEELFDDISLVKCGFDTSVTMDMAANRMHEYYLEEEISRYGVLGIKIELVDLDYVLEEQRKIVDLEYDRLFPDGMK